MQRRRRALKITLGWLLAAVFALSAIVAIPPLRSAAVRGVLSIALSSKSLHLSHVDLTLDARHASARDLIVTNAGGQIVIAARAVDVAYTLSAHGITPSKVAFDELHIVASRRADGSFDLADLVNGGASGAAASPLDLTIGDGRLDLVNTLSPAIAGRSISLRHISGALHLRPGAISHGALTADLASGGSAVPLRASLYENDGNKLARARFSVRGAPLAPAVDLLTSSKAFVVESGTADLDVSAYAIDWPSNAGPSWHLVGEGSVRHGCLRTMPVIVAICGVNGAVGVRDGTFYFPSVGADAAGFALSASGFVTLAPTAALDLDVRARTSLSKLRELLAFSHAMPLGGRVAVDVAVRGDPSSPRADVRVQSQSRVLYGAVPLTRLVSDVYYHDGHAAILSVQARYAGAQLFGDGDIDLTATPVSAQFIAQAKSDAAYLPIVSQLATGGIVRAEGAFAGPLTQLAGDGFADVSGRRAALRVAMHADPTAFTMTALARDGTRGQLFAGVDVGRADGAPASADLIAQRFALTSSGHAVGLPGIGARLVTLPQAHVRVDGAAAMLGTLAVPIGRVALTLSHGSLENVAVPGTGRIVAIDSLSRASLKGTLIGHAWLGDANIARVHARVATRSEEISASAIAASTGKQIHVYGATAQFAGGEVALAGTVPDTRAGDLNAYISHVDGASLAALGVPISAGSITAFAHLTGPMSASRIALTGAIANGVVAGRAISGDGDFGFANGNLAIADARISTAETRVYVSGDVRGIGRSLNDASVHVRAAMPNVDLGSAATSVAGNSAQIAGLAAADMRIGGTVAAPIVSGALFADIGALDGVPFDNLQADITGSPSSIEIENGGIRFGSTQLSVAGSLSPSSVALQVASPHVQLDDFNDFFNGKDVLEGHGSLALTLRSAGRSISARGGAQIRDVVLGGIPVGLVDIALGNQGGAPVATVQQRNALASITARAGLQPAAFSQLMAGGLSSARYSLDAQIRRFDLSALAPYVAAEDQGLAGIVNGSMHAVGPLRAPTGGATLAVSQGSLRGVAIDDIGATVASDGRTIELRSLRADAQKISLAASGAMDLAKRSIAVRAHADVHDLAQVARLADVAGNSRGTATVDVVATGALAAPVVDASVAFPSGELHSVAFDSAGVTARYRDRHLRIAGNMVFARNRGRVDVVGAVPIRLAPFGVGPNDQPIAFRASTTGVAIGVLDPLLHGEAQVGGALDSDVTVGGTVGEPVFAGSAQLRNGVLASRYDTIGARAVNADVSFANDTISLRQFRAVLGAGSMSARGDAHVVPATALRKSPSLQFSLQALFDGAQVNVTNVVDGALSGNVAVTRSARVPYISGDLALSNTSVPFASLLALSSRNSSATSATKAMPGVPAPLPGRVTAYAGSLFASDFTLVTPDAPRRKHTMTTLRIPRTFHLGLRVTAGKNVGVSGAVSAQGTGTIAVAGTTRAPELSGTLTAVRGRAAFVNTRFDLTDGFVTFDPADGLLPTIEANATTSTDTADITVTIAGRVDQLHTDFTSTPEMSRDAIVATLLHIPQINSALASSHGVDQSQVGVNSQDVVTGAVAGQVLGALNVGLNQLLNVGEVNFELDQNGNPGLEVRHPFGPHAYTIFRTTFSVPPAQSFGVAYVVRRALSVEFSQSQSTPGSSPVLAPPLTSIQVQLSFR